VSRKLVLLTSILILSVSTSAVSQGPKFELTPYAGVYVPLTNVFQLVLLPIQGTHQAAVSFGGRATFWFGGPFGLEGSFNYAPSDITGGILNETVTGEAYVWAASGRFMIRVGRLTSPVALLLGGGIGYIGRGGEAYTDFENNGAVGYSGTVALRFKITDNVAIRLDLEDYIYMSKFLFQDVETEGQLQFDLILAAGVSIGFGG